MARLSTSTSPFPGLSLPEKVMLNSLSHADDIFDAVLKYKDSLAGPEVLSHKTDTASYFVMR